MSESICLFLLRLHVQWDIASVPQGQVKRSNARGGARTQGLCPVFSALLLSEEAGVPQCFTCCLLHPQRFVERVLT